LLARVGVASSFQQVESPGQPFENLAGRERCGSRRGQLHGKRKIVEPPTELGNDLLTIDTGTDAEQLDRIDLAERKNGVLDLASDPQELATPDRPDAGDRSQPVVTAPRGCVDPWTAPPAPLRRGLA